MSSHDCSRCGGHQGIRSLCGGMGGERSADYACYCHRGPMARLAFAFRFVALAVWMQETRGKDKHDLGSYPDPKDDDWWERHNRTPERYEAVHVPEPVQPGALSIFLAGPTPRSREVASWRPRALEALKFFPGKVYLPEGRDGKSKHSYDDQIQWETDALHAATCIMFWVPRELRPDANGYPRMGALTTNMEFGMWLKSGKVVLGFPPGAEKMNYLAWHARREGVPVFDSLKATAAAAVDMANRLWT